MVDRALWTDAERHIQLRGASISYSSPGYGRQQLWDYRRVWEPYVYWFSKSLDEITSLQLLIAHSFNLSQLRLVF